MEKAVREIRTCENLEQLQMLAVDSYRAWVTQTNIAAQLIHQLANAEAQLAQAGLMKEPTDEFLRWARELCPDQPAM